MQVPTRMYDAGIAGQPNWTARSFCQYGRRRRKRNNETTDNTEKSVRLKPMYTSKAGNGVTVITMAQMPWLRIAFTGVCQRGCTLAAPRKNALFFAMA